MKCFQCGLTISGTIRWIIIEGERVPFHPSTGSVLYDCGNTYMLEQGRHQSDDTYSIRHQRQQG